MRFGVGLPTCREGTAYPAAYVQADDFARIALRAEALGFDSLWANDHLTTPRMIQSMLGRPPSFYEPLITFASLVGVTRRLRFVLSVLVLPEREPVLLAKQIATLDQLSGGRVVLGVGIGAYREEFESVHPRLAHAHRGAMLDEGIQALRRLFDESSPVSFDAHYLAFRAVELAPRPRQQPFPIYVNADSEAGLDRVARLGDGWIVSAPRPPRLAQLRSALRERSPRPLSTNVQVWVSPGRDRGEAERRLRRSQHFRRLASRHGEQRALDEFVSRNLFGSPDQVCEQLSALEEAGAEHVGLIFLGDSVDDLLADLDRFAEQVLPAFPGQ